MNQRIECVANGVMWVLRNVFPWTLVALTAAFLVADLRTASFSAIAAVQAFFIRDLLKQMDAWHALCRNANDQTEEALKLASDWEKIAKERAGS